MSTIYKTYILPGVSLSGSAPSQRPPPSTSLYRMAPRKAALATHVSPNAAAVIPMAVKRKPGPKKRAAVATPPQPTTTTAASKVPTKVKALKRKVAPLPPPRIEEIRSEDDDDYDASSSSDADDVSGGGVVDDVDALSDGAFTANDWREIKAAEEIDILTPTEWSEQLLERYFYGRLCKPKDEPRLLRLIWRERRGIGYAYWLKCVFEHPRTRREVVQWVRYENLVGNRLYREVIARYDWNIHKEVERDAKLLEPLIEPEKSEMFGSNLEDPKALAYMVKIQQKVDENTEKYMRKHLMVLKNDAATSLDVVVPTTTATTTTTTTTTTTSAAAAAAEAEAKEPLEAPLKRRRGMAFKRVAKSTGGGGGGE